MITPEIKECFKYKAGSWGIKKLSKSGLHIITTPFNISEFNKKYTDIEIHKDNPTNLYIP